MYKFIAVAYELVYHLRCNDIISNAVDAMTKSVVPFCTPSLPLASISASGGDVLLIWYCQFTA